MKGPSEDEICHRIYNQFKNEKFNSRISNKYIDKLQHNSRVIIIENLDKSIDTIMSFDWDTSDFYDFAVIGDSIVKYKGDSIIYLFRNEIDTSFMIDFDCEY